MKKYIVSLALTLAVMASAVAQNVVVSQTVLPGTMTNLYTGAFKISQIVLTSTNASSGYLVDASTNSTVYTTAGYTNTISYLTNYSTFYTNYFGVITTNSGGTSLAGSAFTGTNWALVDALNYVAPTTNNLPSVAVATGSSTPVILNNVNVTGFRGWWVTNTSATVPLTVTITGIRQ